MYIITLAVVAMVVAILAGLGIGALVNVGSQSDTRTATVIVPSSP